MSFEYKTVEELRADILNNISDEHEKSKGNLTYDIPAATAIVLNKTYDKLKELTDKVNVDNLEGEDLTRYVKQRRGLKRKLATKAKAILTITGEANINIGDLFETQAGTQFSSTQAISIVGSGTILAEAVIPGESGNVGANTITLMPVTIQGVVSITNIAPSYDGFAEESDAALRERYYEAIQRPATSGNVFHYMVWAKEVPGTGDAKVISLWNGDNTVKVVVINANKEPASSDIVNAVQEYIDPKGTFIAEENRWTLWGTGSGQAPIGAYCTVISAAGFVLNVSVDIMEEEGYLAEEVKTNIEENITAYLQAIAFKQNYISYAIVGSIIVQTDGVADYQNLKLNNTTANVNIGNEQVAILGSVTLT